MQRKTNKTGNRSARFSVWGSSTYEATSHAGERIGLAELAARTLGRAVERISGRRADLGPKNHNKTIRANGRVTALAKTELLEVPASCSNFERAARNTTMEPFGFHRSRLEHETHKLPLAPRQVP